MKDRCRSWNVLVCLVVLTSLVGCTVQTEQAAPPEYRVSYRVTGSCERASVTITNEDGGTSQFADVEVPWRYDLLGSFPQGTFVYLSAQNQTDSGTISATIVRGSRKFKSSKSEGAYVIAQVSGSL